MKLSRRSFFVLPAFATGLVGFQTATLAAIKPKSTSNKVPTGGGIRKPGYFAEGGEAKTSAPVTLGVALYDNSMQIFTESEAGVFIDIVDVGMGKAYAAGQPISVYLRSRKASSRLVLIDEQSPAGHAIDIDWKTGKLTQGRIPRAATVEGLLTALKVNAKDQQGQIALDGKTNLWEITR
jgi:hypothetical protein